MLQYYLEHFGVAVGAISGGLAAKDKRIDLFGVIVLALVTALGGGTLRDLVLGRPGVFWFHDCTFVLTAVVTAVGTFFVARYWTVPGKLFMIADAFVLAFFTMLGTVKAFAYGAGNVNAVVLGIATGVAGGVFRDVLVSEVPIVFRKETYFYATAAFAGAAAFVALERWLPGNGANRFACIGITLAMRLAAIQWRLTLPEFKA